MVCMTTIAMLFAALLALLAAHANASGSSSLTSDANVDASLTPASASASSSTHSVVTIDTASSTSETLQLVDNVVCNEAVSEMIYVLYNKNRKLFDVCVNEAQYQIFPFLGTHPSAAQVKSMASSTSCVAIFTGVELASLPECKISGMPLKAAIETLLKIHVDLLYGYEDSPSASRFQELMAWRHDVNLAQEAGVPYDSDSELYKQYAKNLWLALTNSSIRVLDDYTVQYQLASSSWTNTGDDDDTITASSSDSDSDDVVGTVSPTDGSKMTNGDNDEASAPATTGSAASAVSRASVAITATSLLLTVVVAA